MEVVEGNAEIRQLTEEVQPVDSTGMTKEVQPLDNAGMTEEVQLSNNNSSTMQVLSWIDSNRFHATQLINLQH